MKARKRPVIVDVRVVSDSEVVLTGNGPVPAEPGDYILTDPTSGDTWPIKPDIFSRTYEVVDE